MYELLTPTVTISGSISGREADQDAHNRRRRTGIGGAIKVCTSLLGKDTCKRTFSTGAEVKWG